MCSRRTHKNDLNATCGLQALSSLVNKSGVPREYIANVQAGKDGDGRDDESDEEYTEAAAVVDKHRGQLLKVIVDPIRKVLSGALFLYARLDADGAPDLVRSVHMLWVARLRRAACARLPLRAWCQRSCCIVC